MIAVDVEKFNRDGYLILPQIVPPSLLDSLRESAEVALERRWPEGIPPETFQPMIHGLQGYVDEDTADLIEFCFREDVLQANRELMGTPVVGPAAIFMMNNPVVEHGPWWWHRDVSPLVTKGPLEGLIWGNRAHGPVVLHWNVALYDDDVYWVVPGSHDRFNTDDENRQLSAVPHGYGNGQLPQGEKRHEPLPGSVCADLRAGDAIVNFLELYHWGSNYSPKLRRTYHIGYRTFAGPRFFYEGYSRSWDNAEFLSPRAQGLLKKFAELYDEECDQVEAVFRAAIEGDSRTFLQSLARLHPGEEARFTCAVHLCRIAEEMTAGRQEEFLDRFTENEVAVLWLRFQALDAALLTDGEQWVPGFQIKAPTRRRLNELPPNFGLEELIASWN